MVSVLTFDGHSFTITEEENVLSLLTLNGDTKDHKCTRTPRDCPRDSVEINVHIIEQHFRNVSQQVDLEGPESF